MTDRATDDKAGRDIWMGSTELISTSNLHIVPDHKPYNGKPWSILTAFPGG
ncbi:hypothetical protein GCM10009414_07200 [Tatumella terrea]